MSLKTLSILILAFSSALGQTVLKEQPADGSVSFQYFDSEAKAAAEKLELLFMSGVNKFATYYFEVNKSNNALTALATYVKAEASAKGTKCYIGGQDENRFANAPQDIERALSLCSLFRPMEDRETFKKAIVEGLKKIQTYDNNLRLNSALCTSLRVPKSQGCIDSEQKARDGIKGVVASGEIDKYEALSKTYLTNAKQFLDSCFTTSTKPLQDQLVDWTKRITDCQKS